MVLSLSLLSLVSLLSLHTPVDARHKPMQRVPQGRFAMIDL